MQNQIIEKDTIKSIYNQKHLNSFESENIDNPDTLRHIKNSAFWIPEEFKSSADILKFYICNSDYLNEHFDSIKPKNKEDANNKNSLSYIYDIPISACVYDVVYKL